MITEFVFALIDIFLIILILYFLFKNHEKKKKEKNIKKAIRVYLYFSIFFLTITLLLILFIIIFQLDYILRSIFSLFIVLSFFGIFYTIIGWEDLRIKSRKDISSK